MAAGKIRTNRIETEIEKSREAANWKKVIELAELLKNRNSSELLANFLIGEGKLESYLEEHSPSEENVDIARKGLLDAKKFLQSCINDSSKKEKSVLTMDVLLLLAKLEYAAGNYETVLSHLSDAGLEQLHEKTLATRLLRIVAESFAVKGICLEKTAPSHTSKFKYAEREEKIVKCFELAGDLTLLYLQEQDKLPSTSSYHTIPTTGTLNSTGSTPHPPYCLEEKKVGIILETALQRAPLLHIKSSRLEQAILRYRNMLMAEESSATQHLRLILATQLAEVLIRGCCERSYKTPLRDEKSHSGYKAVERPWKPRKHTGANLFSPRNINEEIILLLMISEAMAAREAVLSQSPESKKARMLANDNAMTVYDLLCITLSRWKKFNILLEVFDRAMKFSYESYHIWRQYSLALASAQKFQQSLLVLEEVHRLQPLEPYVCLLAAKLCFQHLRKIDDGMSWVGRAIRAMDDTNNHILSSRCHLYQGIGLYLQAQHSVRLNDAYALRTKALEAFMRAQQLDQNDHLVEFYIGLHLSLNSLLLDAVQHVKMALCLRSEHIPSILLLILLLSAQKEYEEALELTKAALIEYPEHMQLLFVCASLEEVVFGAGTALLTAKHMLSLWQTSYKEQIEGDSQDQQLNTETHSVYNMSEKDAVSLNAESIAASRVEAALSEVASSLSSYQPRPGPHQAWILQIQIWLLTAHLYIKTEQFNEASQCVQEASSIFPMSHHIMFMGKVYHYIGSYSLAEKILLDAIKVDPSDHKAWFLLGEVTAAMGHLDASTRCLATALEAEARSPLIPFSSVPVCFE